MNVNARALVREVLAGTCLALLATVVATQPPGAPGPPSAPTAPDPARYPLRHFDGGVVALNDATYASQPG